MIFFSSPYIKQLFPDLNFKILLSFLYNPVYSHLPPTPSGQHGKISENTPGANFYDIEQRWQSPKYFILSSFCCCINWPKNSKELLRHFSDKFVLSITHNELKNEKSPGFPRALQSRRKLPLWNLFIYYNHKQNNRVLNVICKHVQAMSPVSTGLDPTIS